MKAPKITPQPTYEQMVEWLATAGINSFSDLENSIHDTSSRGTLCQFDKPQGIVHDCTGIVCWECTLCTNYETLVATPESIIKTLCGTWEEK